MEQKEIKINCPEGFIIDKENSTFECIKFKPIENKLPKTWEEFCETHNVQESEYWITFDCKLQKAEGPRLRHISKDLNLLPSKELAEAMLALCQLIQLRDCYNDGWKPDWTDENEYKYVIFTHKGEILLDRCWSANRILAFKIQELRDQFFKNFKELIEIAKPLL